MKFTSTTQSAKEIKSDLLIVPIFENEKSLEPKTKELDEMLDGQISDLLKSRDFEGKYKDSSLLYTRNAIGAPRVLTLGLGKKSEFDLERLRTTISAAAPIIKKFKVKKAGLLLSRALPKNTDVAGVSQAIAESLVLSGYEFLKYKKPEKKTVDLEEVEFLLDKPVDKAKVSRGSEAGLVVATAINFARDLSNHPGNVLTPQMLADEAVELAKTNKLKCKILEKEEMKKLGMGAFLGVNQGSTLPPKFIIMEYNAKKPGRPTVLVGKGITFDTGGISIKPSSKMEEMKFDMCGAATVMGIMKAASELRLTHKLIGIIPATENMPSGNAIKPGDIVRAMNGKTIQVTNTDAEGRMILADALCYAERYKPKNVIDYATLTGSMVVALGTEYTGYLANDEKLSAKLEKASATSGEKIWRFPLAEVYKEKIKSPVADIDNIGTQQGAGHITAALILQEFVSYPWAHLDIAGTAWTTAPKPMYPIGATGVGIKLTLEFLK